MSEVERFLSLPREQRNSDPIEWWESHKDEFKLLVPMALQYLCTPPSSVDSERLFSSAKQVYTDNRNRLGTDIAEKLIFIMRNDRKVQAIIQVFFSLTLLARWMSYREIAKGLYQKYSFSVIKAFKAVLLLSARRVSQDISMYTF